jgi:diaminohydroxyphosphoribosylaminopyrimidine deaminase/5-amino-6-(5-phosphoribosylamino)uracil reductase
VVELANGARDLVGVLGELKAREIQSVLVEGGAAVAGAFCDARLADKVTLIAAPMIIGGGEAPMAIGGRGASSLSDAIRLSSITIDRHGDDIEITGYPTAAA